MRHRPAAALVLALFAGCAAPAPGHGDGGADAGLGDLGAADLAGGADLAGCTLGSPDHCGTCGTQCPPYRDDGGTARTCSDSTAFGTCGLECRGEAYDVDGQLQNGCEAFDLPRQDSVSTAVALTLPDVNDATNMSNPLNVVAYVYSDARTHLDPPAQRPNGREDWYRVTAVGTGAPGGMVACLGIVNFPSDNTFEVCITDNGQTTFGTACAQVVGGGGSMCVSPPAATDAGTYYVRVRKLAGTPTLLGYALYLKH